jgi:HAD superfamily hydrolase (TIGR01509 family)
MGAHLPAAVIFDMDGTLLDTERMSKRAWPVAAAALGVDFDADLPMAMVGHNTRDCARMIVERHGPAFPVDKLMQAMRDAYDNLVEREGIVVMPGAVDLIAWLHARHIPMAVATSTRRVRAEAKLAATGLLPHFAALVGGDEVEHGKPAPDIYVAAAARLGQHPARCIAVEDSEAGYLSAHRAGMTVVLVPDLMPPSSALLALDAHVEPTLAGVQHWLAHK